MPKKQRPKLVKSQKKRETPVLVYNSLNLYGTVRSKGIIDNFFHLGLCVSYDRVLELTKEFADSLVKGYNINGVFCPKTLETGVFTIIAKGNIDHNARSTTATQHYHGTSMTAMQFIAEDNRGEDRIPLTRSAKSRESI